MLKSKEEPVEKAFPPVIKGALQEFKDAMSKKLLKRLPSRREVDRVTKLEPRAKPHVMAPYHMAPP